jgi:hypothetical protein
MQDLLAPQNLKFKELRKLQNLWIKELIAMKKLCNSKRKLQDSREKLQTLLELKALQKVEDENENEGEERSQSPDDCSETESLLYLDENYQEREVEET